MYEEEKISQKNIEENTNNEIILINNISNKYKNQRNKLVIKNRISSAKLPFNKTISKYQTEEFSTRANNTGFFNKKFNLDNYKKLRENMRLKLKLPKKKLIFHHKRGNGIPDNIFERMKFFEKKFNEAKFIKYYNKKPKKNSHNFNETIDYLIKYSKTHSDLEKIMMAFYFVCKEIKFDQECYNNNEEMNSDQSPIKVYEDGLALSSGFTNLFEYILKKMEIKFKHIDGYCKIMPKKNPIKKLKQKKLNRVQSAKNFNEKINELNDTINHSWNAFYYKGEWYFCDCLFASGSIKYEEDEITKINLKQLNINNNFYNYNSINSNENSTKKNETENSFNFFYFMIPPELLISTHRPIDDTWQFIPKTLSFKEFYNKKTINYGEFYYNVFKYKIKLLSHFNPLISIYTKDKLQIKIKLEGHLLEANLIFYSFGNVKLSEVKNTYDESNEIYTFEPVLQQKGEYILKINARAILSMDLLYWPLLDYIIKVDNFFQLNEKSNFISNKISKLRLNKNIKEILPKLIKNQSSKKIFTPKIISDYSIIFPPKSVKKICYDTEDFRLIEPKNGVLKKGENTKFKIFIKGTEGLSILDGNHMTFLKRREDGSFNGQRIIETNNVSLCCLRGKYVFTELYKFKVLNESRVLSAKTILTKKKNRILK